VREQVELDFSMHPLEPAFVVLAFAYRPRLGAKLRYQLPHFYYVWNGEQGELNHASAEERDKIVARIGKKRIPPGLLHEVKTEPGDKPAVENEVASPKIRLSAGPNVTDSYSINRWGTMPVRFLHPVVSIDSGTIRNCTGYLQRVKKNDNEWTIGDQLTFSSSSKPRGELTKTLHHEARARLDVLVITSGQEIRVCNEERDWRRWPSLRDIFAEIGDYLLEVAIVGEGVALQTFTLRFEWTGDWQTSFLHGDAPTQPINRLPNPSGSLKPIEKRDSLDVFIRIGEELLSEWCSKRNTLTDLEAQTQQWLQAVYKFVREYFDIKHNRQTERLQQHGQSNRQMEICF